MHGLLQQGVCILTPVEHFEYDLVTMEYFGCDLVTMEYFGCDLVSYTLPFTKNLLLQCRVEEATSIQ